MKKKGEGDYATTSITKSFDGEGSKHDENTIYLVLSAHANFLNKANIMKTLDEIEDGKDVVIDLSRSVDIDYDVAEAIRDFKISADDREITLEIMSEEKLGGASLGH